MRSLQHALTLLGSLAALAGCRSMSPPGTAFATDPPGARVYVDGRDSGWVTPCEMALDLEEQHDITLALAGYAPSAVEVSPTGRYRVVSWSQGVNGVKSTIIFPLLLPIWDFLAPFEQHEGTWPGRVFVRLRPLGAP